MPLLHFTNNPNSKSNSKKQQIFHTFAVYIFHTNFTNFSHNIWLNYGSIIMNVISPLTYFPAYITIFFNRRQQKVSKNEI